MYTYLQNIFLPKMVHAVLQKFYLWCKSLKKRIGNILLVIDIRYDNTRLTFNNMK